MSNLTLKEKDLKYVWHPFTQMTTYSDEYLLIKRADKNFLFDENERAYFDGCSSLWCNVHGHGHPKLVQAIKDQADLVSHSTLLGLSHEPSILLAERLSLLTNHNLPYSFYSESGSTAVEIGLKMAFQNRLQEGYAKKVKFAHLSYSYHGDTVGAVSVGGIELFHNKYGGLIFETIELELKDLLWDFEGDVEAWSQYHKENLIQVIGENQDCLAAVIVEPLMQGASGMRYIPDGYLKTLRMLCNQYSIIMIVDEVATGFGRTGTLFACEQEDIWPDIMILGKGLSGGYLPLANTMVKQHIYDSFLGEYGEWKTFYHGHTFTGNPLAAAVSLANLDIFKEEMVLETIQEKIDYISQCLQQLTTHPYVFAVRQRGMMVGIEIIKDRKSKEPFEKASHMGRQVTLKARDYGVIIRNLSDVIIWMPPLSSNIEELDLLYQATLKSLNSFL